MYRIRLGCAAYARMNTIPRQTTVYLGGVKGEFSSEMHDVHRRRTRRCKQKTLQYQISVVVIVR